MRNFFRLTFGITLALAMVLVGARSVGAQAFPAGCSSTSGYSPSTGVSCNGVVVASAGCSSTAGFSTTTGLACNGSTAAANGYNGVVYGTNGYLNGCTSTFGYSTTTGYACNISVVGGTGSGTTTGTTTGETPGLPTTGSSPNANLLTVFLVLLGIVALTSIGYAIRHNITSSSR